MEQILNNGSDTMVKEAKNNVDLSKVIKEIEQNYGKGSVMFLGDGVDAQIKSISSGSFLINNAIGIGGYPKGRITEIYGPESSGKTTLALHAITESQTSGGIAAFIDAEHSLDPNYARNLGVDTDNLIVSQPDSGEQALDILELLVKSGAVDIIVIDSVAALVPKIELEGEMGDQQIGSQARLMSKALRKLTAITAKTNTVVIFINQLREKIGVIFGSPEVTTGGRALKFFSSLRMEVRKGEAIIVNGEIRGNKVKVKIVKNKVSISFKSVQITIEYNTGINKYDELVEVSTIYEILTKNGVWYSYNGEKIGQGKQAVISWLKENQNTYNDIYQQLNEKIHTKES